jgi:alanyl-tRNA synthetase
MTKTDLLYLETQNCLQAAVHVISSGQDDTGCWVELDRTPFYVHGGGQPADRGTLGDVAHITDVRRVDGQVRHYINLVNTTIELGACLLAKVDEDRRLTNAAWHSSGHLVAIIAEACLPGVQVTGGNHHPGAAWLIAPWEQSPPQDLVGQMNDHVRRIITADLPLLIVPGLHRTVAVGEYPAVGCGGTHVASTAALRGLRVTKVTHKQRQLRVSYCIDA